jgi:hypothetical protein
MIITLFIASGVSLVTFVVTELKANQPFVDIRLYKNLPFAMGCLIGFLSTMLTFPIYSFGMCSCGFPVHPL